MTPTSVFDLGRMRQIDLLALYFRLNPDTHEGVNARGMGRAPAWQLIGAITAPPPPARPRRRYRYKPKP